MSNYEKAEKLECFAYFYISRLFQLLKYALEIIFFEPMRNCLS